MRDLEEDGDDYEDEAETASSKEWVFLQVRDNEDIDVRMQLPGSLRRVKTKD